MASRTTDVDKGATRIIREAKKLDGSFTTIGIHEGAGEYPTTTPEGKQQEAVSIVQVAFWNEFGTSTAPERSFLRSTWDENRRLLERQARKSIDAILAGTSTVEKELDKVGTMIRELVRTKIEKLRSPPNAPGTIAGKPSVGDNPLIHTRLLKRSIEHRVEVS